MKLFKRSGEYRASNLSFDPETGTAHSYGWWILTRRIGGVLYLNTYRYSPSTGKHVVKMRDLLRELGTQVVEVRLDCNLRDLDLGTTNVMLGRQNDKILALRAEISQRRKDTAAALQRDAALYELGQDYQTLEIIQNVFEARDIFKAG